MESQDRSASYRVPWPSACAWLRLPFRPPALSRAPAGCFAAALPGALRCALRPREAQPAALFFLISGFVIIRSVERISSAQFLLQRFFRIIPTCMAAVVFVAFVTWLVCKQAGLEHPNSLQSLWTSSFALNFYNGAFATIPVLWTLEVEIAFYLLVAVLAATPMGLTSRGLIATSVVCLLFVSLSASPAGLGLPPSVVRITQHWSTILVHISFMLVGSLIYRAYTAGNWARRLPLVVIAVLLYWVNLTVLMSATANQGIGATLNDCMAALVIFVAGMLAGLEAGWLKPLRWIGSISYPLYLLHVPLAWMLLYAFARLGLGMNIAGLLSVSIIIFASWLMHRTIEMPSQNFGKRLAKLLPPRRVTAPAIASAESAVG